MEYDKLSINQRNVFSSLHREVFGVLSRYETKVGIKLDSSVLVAPTYTPENVHVLNKKYNELGEQLRTELVRVRLFGEPYKYQDDDSYNKEYFMKVFWRAFDLFYNEKYPNQDDDLEDDESYQPRQMSEEGRNRMARFRIIVANEIAQEDFKKFLAQSNN